MDNIIKSVKICDFCKKNSISSNNLCFKHKDIHTKEIIQFYLSLKNTECVNCGKRFREIDNFGKFNCKIKDGGIDQECCHFINEFQNHNPIELPIQFITLMKSFLNSKKQSSIKLKLNLNRIIDIDENLKILYIAQNSKAVEQITKKQKEKILSFLKKKKK